MKTRVRTIAALTVAGILISGRTLGWAAEAPSVQPNVQTVGDLRDWIAAIEQVYDARVGRALASFYAAGATAQRYLLADCLRPQTAGELSLWLRTTAPPDLTLVQALRLNGREHGCDVRDQADVDAELAIRPGLPGQRP